MKKSKSSFSSKPLSYKIAYVIVFILILLLFTGAVGGNIYLFKSMRRNNITAYADGVGGSTEEYTYQTTALNTSNIFMYIEGGEANGYNVVSSLWRLNYQKDFNDGVAGYVAFEFVTTSHSDTSNSYPMANAPQYNVYELPTEVGGGFIFEVGLYNLAQGVYFPVNVNFALECIEVVENGIANTVDYMAQVIFSFVSTDRLPDDEASPPMQLEIYDIQGNYFKYEISVVQNLYSFYHNSPRYVYDVQVPSTEGADTLYNRGFKAGFERATAGLEADIQEAYDRGSRDGELIGYDRGLREQNLFTFDKLANAVVFAPVKTFVSLFNFEILGYNMLSFASFILTAIVVFGILKFFL